MTAGTLAGILGISDHWNDAKVIAGAVAAVVAATFGVAKALRKVGDGFAWCRDLARDIARTLHLVEYHLGENGTTEPLRDRVDKIDGRVDTLAIVTTDMNARMRTLEVVHNVDNPAPLPEEGP